MSSRIEVHIGQPIDDPTELRFLERLRGDLQCRGVDALILANFIAGRRYRQIDFLIHTAARTVHAELKGYRCPIEGGTNGFWLAVQDNHREALGAENPYRQTHDGTYGISDQMRDLARTGVVRTPSQGQFYKHIDSVVCVYPEIADGSRLQRHRHVKAVGYTDLLARLQAEGPRIEWSGAEWEEFLRAMGVYALDPPSEEMRERAAAAALVDEYSRRFASAQGADLHERIVLAVLVEGAAADDTIVSRLVRDEGTIILTGASGTGKTHLARHVAFEFAREGGLAIWLRCSEYQPGELSTLLRRSTAPFTRVGALEMIKAARATGRAVLIVLDGLNELPSTTATQLLQQLNATMIRDPVGVLVTAQTVPRFNLPEDPVVEVALQVPGEDERAALLESYGAESSAGVSEAFRSPFDLALAAECVGELPESATRADLMDAYLRRVDTGKVAVRVVLRQLAASLGEEVRSLLPVGQALRALERTGADPNSIDDAMTCRIVRVVQGQIGYAHEQFAQFLTAEHFVIVAASGGELGVALRQPRYSELRELALEIERDPQRIREALLVVEDAELVTKALRGELGDLVSIAAREEAQRLLEEAALLTDPDSVSFESRAIGGTLRASRKWTRGERAFLTGIGGFVHGGRVIVEPVVTLMDRTDAALAAKVSELRVDGVQNATSVIVSAAYGLPRTDATRALAASVIVEGCHHSFSRRGGPKIGASTPLVRALISGSEDSASWGRLYLACLILDAEDADAHALVAPLVAEAWAAGGYHLKLEALEMAKRVAGRLDESERADLASLLELLQSNHLALRSMLVEALAACDVIAPMSSLETLLEEIDLVLQQPDDPEAWAEARRLVAYQLEDEAVVGPYSEAIGALSPDDRAALLVMAARALEPDDFYADWMLSLLSNEADLHDPIVQAVFRSRASNLPRRSVSNQSLVRAHLLAVSTCAQFDASLPDLPGDGGDDHRAWQCIRELLFLAEKGHESSSDAAELWHTVLHELPRAAADVIVHLADASIFADDQETSPVNVMTTNYPDQIRELLEAALTLRDQLTTYFDWSPEEHREQKIVHVLGVVGSTSTAELLRQFIPDPTLGITAVSAIRQIERRG